MQNLCGNVEIVNIFERGNGKQIAAHHLKINKTSLILIYENKILLLLKLFHHNLLKSCDVCNQFSHSNISINSLFIHIEKRILQLSY